MKVNFIWLGKAKHKYTDEGVKLYHKRIQHYTKSQIIELKDVKARQASEQLKKEAILFDKYIDNKTYTICMHERGRNLSSTDLAEFIEKLQNGGKQQVNFIIGGAHGFTPKTLEQCDYKLSLSNMTLPHDLCRVVLLEQIYRAYTIIKNEKYHNP